MKYSLILSFCFLFLIQSATAQFKQGMIFGGGSLSGSDNYYPNKDSIDETQNSWSSNLSPTIGYYYNDHAAVGLSLTYGFNKDDQKLIFDDTTITQQQHGYSFGAAPFWRYNKSVTDRFGFYGLLSPSIGYSVSDGAGEDKNWYWNFGASAQVGVYYFLFERFSLQAGLTPLNLSYNNDYTSDTTRANSHNFGFNSQSGSYSISSFSVSFFYYFLP